jgi:predicted branched-subunit amino acid permease
MAPLVAGYLPFAFTIGAAAGASQAPVAGWSGSWLLFGGSAHLAVLRGVAQGAPAIAVLTALVVHFRLAVYATALRPAWADQPRWFRILGPGLLIDPTYAAAERRASEPGDTAARRAHFLGSALTLGSAWSAGIAAGVLLGATTTAWTDLLVLAVPLCLAALVVPRVKTGDGRAVVVGAAVVAAVLVDAPAGLGTIAAMAAGVAAGAWRRRR